MSGNKKLLKIRQKLNTCRELVEGKVAHYVEVVVIIISYMYATDTVAIIGGSNPQELLNVFMYIYYYVHYFSRGFNFCVFKSFLVLFLR